MIWNQIKSLRDNYMLENLNVNIETKFITENVLKGSLTQIDDCLSYSSMGKLVIKSAEEFLNIDHLPCSAASMECDTPRCNQGIANSVLGLTAIFNKERWYIVKISLLQKYDIHIYFD